MKTDIRVNAYIEKAAGFAQPILDEIRERVHSFCPEVEETLKWQCPHFMYKDRILCNMVSFKNHCAFGFWLAPIMDPSHFNVDAFGDFGKLKELDSLPSREAFGKMIAEAMGLIDSGRTLPKKGSIPVEVPAEIMEVLENEPLAKAGFEKLPPSHKKEYVQWILEAKTEVTKQKRMDQMLELVAEGKSRQWKYQ